MPRGELKSGLKRRVKAPFILITLAVVVYLLGFLLHYLDVSKINREFERAKKYDGLEQFDRGCRYEITNINAAERYASLLDNFIRSFEQRIVPIWNESQMGLIAQFSVMYPKIDEIDVPDIRDSLCARYREVVAKCQSLYSEELTGFKAHLKASNIISSPAITRIQGNAEEYVEFKQVASSLVAVLRKISEETKGCNDIDIEGFADEVERDGSIIDRELRLISSKITERQMSGSCSRYELLDNSGQPVLYDAERGLIWQTAASVPMTFKDAHNRLRAGNYYAGYSDWRLPSQEEAKSLWEAVKNTRGLFICQQFDLGNSSEIWMNTWSKGGDEWGMWPYYADIMDFSSMERRIKSGWIGDLPPSGRGNPTINALQSHPKKTLAKAGILLVRVHKEY